MEITSEDFINNCKTKGFLMSLNEAWIPEILKRLKEDKKREHAIELLNQMSKLITELLTKKEEPNHGTGN